MLPNELSFKALYWKSPMMIVIFAAIIYGSFSIFYCDIIDPYTSLLTYILAIVIFLMVITIFLLMVGFFTEIIINKNGIEYYSFTKNIKLEWKDIKMVGCYVNGGSYYTYFINTKKIDKFIFFGQKYLFVSKEKYPLYTPYFIKSEIPINFQYRPDALMLIQKHLKENDNESALLSE
jgi:hypothetical protein